MSKLVLISHGHFCEELKKSAEMIMGPQEDIATVPLLESEGPEDFQAKLEEAIAGDDNTTVMADLKGGTPNNVAARLLQTGSRFELFAGANLAMVISYLNAQMLGSTKEEAATSIVDEAKAGIQRINDLLKL